MCYCYTPKKHSQQPSWASFCIYETLKPPSKTNFTFTMEQTIGSIWVLRNIPLLLLVGSGKGPLLKMNKTAAGRRVKSVEQFLTTQQITKWNTEWKERWMNRGAGPPLESTSCLPGYWKRKSKGTGYSWGPLATAEFLIHNRSWKIDTAVILVIDDAVHQPCDHSWCHTWRCAAGLFEFYKVIDIFLDIALLQRLPHFLVQLWTETHMQRGDKNTVKAQPGGSEVT